MNLNHLKRDIIQATQTAYTGHVPSALSVLDIIYVLYHNAMQDGDRFVLSKGHAALALYAVLADMGTITRDAMLAFGTYGAACGGHPDACKVPGVEFSTGGLGHGLGMAAGMACGLHGPRVFCLIGDGEMQEGATLEALRLIGSMALPITVILDSNATHPCRGAVDIFQAYGFVTVECNGHNDYRGWWSTRWDAQIILYNPADLQRVAAGEIASWEPQPYASLTIDEHLFFNPTGIEADMIGNGEQRRFLIGDVAYDRAHDLLYILELFADEAAPIVHAWKLH